jgi:hypothetical protein
MSFETINPLLNWMEMLVLLAILFRLSSTFELIANTQRELRRAIHRLGEHPAAELGISNTFGERGIGLVPRSTRVRMGAKSRKGPDHLAHLSS